MRLSVVEKYLARYAHPLARDQQFIADAPRGPFERAVVIPACDESTGLFDAVQALGAQTLKIVVVNGPDGNARVRSANLELLDAGRGRSDVWMVDQTQGHRHGVGGARRIGFDLALGLHSAGTVAGRFLHGLDADCSVAADFFACEDEAEASDVAIIHPYRHVDRGAAPQIALAHRRYELSLRHYVLGLEAAGSPYAHSSIGSTIAVDATAYANVRGVPMREAGEDFHLLDKLRTVGPILRARRGEVAIEMRRSSRVPFGTGPAVEGLLRGEHAKFYAWESFAVLGHVRRLLIGHALSGVTDSALPAELDELMGALGLRKALAHLPCAGPGPRARAVDVLFSGLKSLRLLHILRDRGVATVDYTRSCTQTPFLSPGEAVDAALERVRALQARLPPRAAGLGSTDANADVVEILR